MYRIVISFLLLAGEAAAHPGHGVAAGHLHGWEYALLVAAIIAVVAGWFRAKK